MSASRNSSSVGAAEPGPEIDDDPVGRQLAQLVDRARAPIRAAGVRDRAADRRRRRSSFTPGTCVATARSASGRPPCRERLGQRARRPRHAGEEVEVRRTERAVDEDRPACRASRGRSRRSQRPGSCRRRPCRRRSRPPEESSRAVYHVTPPRSTRQLATYGDVVSRRTVRTSSQTRPSAIRATIGTGAARSCALEVIGRASGERDRKRRQLGGRHRAATDRRGAGLDRDREPGHRADRAGEPLARPRGARAAVRASMRTTGTSRGATVAIERERRGEPGERELVGAQRAHQRVLARGVDRGRRADRDAGLRAAEQLVAGERDEVGAARDGLGDRRLVGQAPRALRSRDRRACPSRDRSSSRRRARGRSRRPRRQLTSAVNPTIAKFERWTLSNRPVAGPIARS